MGKPAFSSRPSDDAVSLHTQPGDRFLDDDAPELQVDDLPPLYEDIAGSSGDSDAAPLLPSTASTLLPPTEVACFKRDATTGAEYYMSERLDASPKLLQQHIERCAKTPPRPYARLLGTHTQTVDKNGKRERETVTDFDVQVELTPYLFSDAVNRVSLSELRTVENTEKVHRGTVFACRDPRAKQHIEVGVGDKPDLQEWCHRYHASHAALKSFVLRRRVVGFDEDKVRQKLEALVCATNYRGSLSVTFPVKDETIYVYNKAKLNRWRLTPWIVWLCVCTLMFTFTWPFLFFRTKRFEVVTADWAFSLVGQDGRKRYASISEDQWYNMWARAINRAVLEKRQCTLDQQDLLAAEGAPPVFGHAVVDGAMGFLRAGVSAMNEVNRQLGWGGDC